MTVKPKESISSVVVNLLREIQIKDPEAFASLVTWRTGVNAELQKHPTLQLSTARGKSQLSLVGLLNSILVSQGERKIAAIVDNDVVVGFTELEQDVRTLITQVQPMAGSAGD